MYIVSWLAAPGPWRTAAGGCFALCLAGAGAQRAAAGPEMAPPSALQEATRELEGLLREGRYRDAEAAARRVLAEIAGREGPDSLAAADVMQLLAEAMRLGGKIIDPETHRYAERAVAIKERVLGPEHPALASALSEQASVQHAAGKYSTARALFEKARAIHEKAPDSESPELAKTLAGLGVLLSDMGDPSGARSMFERALSIREKRLAADDPDLALSLAGLARLLVDLDELERARALFERALGVLEKTADGKHPQLAATLESYAGVFSYRSEFTRARELLDRALAMQKELLGPDHPALADTLSRLASVVSSSESDTDALPLRQRVLALRERALGPEHPYVAHALKALAMSNRQVGDYEAARALYERAISILERVLGPENVEFISALGDMGIALWLMGERAEARDLFERALAADEKVYGPDHTIVAEDLNSLGLCLYYSGDYTSARPLLERALAIREKSYGPNDIDVAGSLNNLSLLLYDIGELRAARRLTERAVAIYEKVGGPGVTDLGRVLGTLANILRNLAEYEGAGKAYERSVEITMRTAGREHPFLGEVLEDYGKLRVMMGNLAAARGLFERSFALRQETLGPDHPEVAMSLVSLARLDWLEGHAASALERALRAESIVRRHFHETARSLSEREALRWEEVRTSGLDVALSVLASRGPADLGAQISGEIWDQVIRSRAMVLDEIAGRSRSAFGSGDPQAASLAKRLDGARNRLAALVVGGPDAAGPRSYQDEVKRAMAEKERAERALAERSYEYRRERNRQSVGLEKIRDALPAETALVAYVQYQQFGGVSGQPGASASGSTGQPSYLCFVLSPGMPIPRVLPLGTAADLDPLIQAWREQAGLAPGVLPSAARQGEVRYREAGELLRRRLWEPVAAALGNARKAFIVPDGLLNLVSFSTLPAAGGRYLADAGPVVHYLSTERDLASDRESGVTGHGLLVLGGPDYDAKPSATAARNSAIPPGIRAPSQSVLGRASGYRGPASPCSDLHELNFSPLPSARREADQVEEIWRKAEGADRTRVGEVVKLVGQGAGEGALKRMIGGRRVVHLATHGFFAQENCPPEQGGHPGRGTSAAPVPGGGMAPMLAENPLLLSGLALAGANRRGAAGVADGARAGGAALPAGAPSDADGQTEDGILTAEEIAGLDLSGVEWAVLSACETGVGKVQAGEGVLGLRRAFEVAGAGTLIMSLWPVEDAATREWMRLLYEGRLSGMSTAEAVQNASLGVLQARRRAGLSTHPFYWGAFVAAGDWR